jgi:vancomycin resistance protein YoaR
VTSTSDQTPTADDLPTVALPLGSPGTGRPVDPTAPRDAWRPGAAPTPWKRRLLVTGIAASLIAGAAAGGAVVLANRDDVPRTTTVLGVDIGGKSRDEATAALRAHLTARSSDLSAPVVLSAAGKRAKIKPADVGLEIDVDATITTAANVERGTQTVPSGTGPVEPVVRVDPQRLSAALNRAFGKPPRKMQMPAIVFRSTTPTPIYPKPGRDYDLQRSVDAVKAGWLRGGVINVPLVDVQPTTSTDDIDRLMTTLARPSVAAPVQVKSARGTLTIPPTAIARSLILNADRTGKITPRIDAKKLRASLKTELARLESAPRDARVTITGGRPQVKEGSPGASLNLAATTPTLLTVLQQEADRTVNAPVVTVAPTVTAAKVARLGIKERVSTFTTKFPGGLASPRSHNIVQIAKEVDGALVQPGKVFSLNGYTGERGYAQGYKDAPVILDGKLTPGVGGGASQFTTTLFNATYYAGLEDVEHKPHSYWFSRYPPVIESTIFYPNLDFKFRNNTPYGVLIDTSYTNSTITVSVWSTKVYDKVTTEWGPRRNVTTPRTIRLEAGPECIATSGIDGFSQDAWRLFHRGGKVTKREKFSWRYEAEPRYICTKKP